MISRTESVPEMILLLKGLAKTTAAAERKNAATKNRTVSVLTTLTDKHDSDFGHQNRHG
jgi:hypothetical protein